jgi:hypothetical protein
LRLTPATKSRERVGDRDRLGPRSNDQRAFAAAQELAMNIGPSEAAAALIDIESIARKVKQSSWYRLTSTMMMLWGILVALGYAASQLAPQSWLLIWSAVNGVGIVAAVAFMAYDARARGQSFDARSVIAILLFFGFGLLWTRLLGRFGARESDAFWPTLFMFGYAVAGLWLGRALVAIGLAISTLVIGGYLWIGEWFELYLALVAGGGLILCGLWMRWA